MAKMEQLQEVWEAKDLDGVMSFFTDDYETVSYTHLRAHET